jgi:adenine-specific DNA-methyltransferase
VPRVNLPFQVIETVNESRATREAKTLKKQRSLFETYEGKEGDTFEEGWKNKLIWGDNLLVTGSLLEKFAGKVRLIYLDPPFATGADFSFSAEIGDGAIEIEKEQSAIEEKAYRDTWGRGTDSYVAMMHERLILMRELLCENGTLYLHCDWRVNSVMRLMLDEIFGNHCYKATIVWQKLRSVKSQSLHFSNMHDTILMRS